MRREFGPDELMRPDASRPVIVQSDRSILLEVDSPVYTDARDALASGGRYHGIRARKRPLRH